MGRGRHAQGFVSAERDLKVYLSDAVLEIKISESHCTYKLKKLVVWFTVLVLKLETLYLNITTV